jgi:hypothetical protein
MSDRFSHLPLDHPYLARLHAVHQMDRNPDTTSMALGIVDDALAAGHPADETAAIRVMTGASAAAHCQALIQPHLTDAIDHDVAANEHSVTAMRWSEAAREDAEHCRALPAESVRLADGSSLTRGQVHGRQEQLLDTAAQREGRGDFEHTQTPPGPAIRALLVTVLSVIEVFLLIWPVTDASWADVSSVGYVAGLVAIFLVMNELLPKRAGHAIRAAREARHAAWEITSVGLSEARCGRELGRQLTGHVDERQVRAAERRKWLWCCLLGGVLAVYAAVMFTRVQRLAAGMGLGLPFVLLAAGLITIFTAGSVIVVAIWWSAGNSLGDQLREHGAIVGESRALAAACRNRFREHASYLSQAADLARSELDLAEQALQDGYQAVGLGLQKAAKLLDLQTVPTPRPENLFPAGRPIRDRAVSNIATAHRAVLAAERAMAESAPFTPTGPAPNPWKFRSWSRQAPANPAFVDPFQRGVLHGSPPADPIWRVWTRPAVAIALMALAALAAVVLAARL